MTRLLSSLDSDAVIRPITHPAVRVSADYAGTDGRLPEHLEVSWETTFPGVALLLQVVDALIDAPTHRR